MAITEIGRANAETLVKEYCTRRSCKYANEQGCLVLAPEKVLTNIQNGGECKAAAKEDPDDPNKVIPGTMYFKSPRQTVFAPEIISVPKEKHRESVCLLHQIKNS